MLTHIVLWKLHATAEGRTKSENAILLKEKLESLVEIIPQIVELKVGINLATADATNYDVMLYSKFDRMETMMEYQNHPAHKAVGEWIGKIRESRVAIDF
jgi:hypothetical protein